MTVRWADDAFEDLSQSDREALLSWLRQAWEMLSLDATQSGNQRAMDLVQGWWRDAAGLTNASPNSAVLSNLENYATAFAYGLAHPTSSGRIHAAPKLNAAIPFALTVGETIDPGPPASGGFFGSTRGTDAWNALERGADGFYPPGDNLAGAIHRWRQEFMDDASGLGIARSPMSGVRSGRLLRMAQARLDADRVTRANTNPQPQGSTNPRGDVTQEQSSGGGWGTVALILGGLLWASQKRR